MKNYPRTAIITGISGQDGLISTNILINNGWNVIGVTRDLDSKRILELKNLYKSIKFVQVDNSTGFYANLITEFKPALFLHWGSPSSVMDPWGDPINTLNELIIPSANILQAIAENVNQKTALMLPLSSEIFAKDGCGKASTSERKLQSIYAIGKSTLFDLANLYREKYELQIFAPILFPHVSPLQSSNFFTGKIMKAIIDIKSGSTTKTPIGDLEAKRDWSWAPAIIEYIISEIEKGANSSETIGSGSLVSTSEIIENFFFAADILDWKSYFSLNSEYVRKESSLGNFALNESGKTFNSPKLADWSKSYVESALQGKFLDYSTIENNI